MKKTINLLLSLFFLSSCFEKRANEVNVNSIDERIYIGMPKEDLKIEIGEPADSTTIDYNLGEYKFMYYTNDFADYRLNIYFDENDKVSSYSID